MANENKQSIGKVYLVGAGPGDPGMITLRGAECLRRGEVILYDYLVNPAILSHTNAFAELICLGHHGHSRIWSQDEINNEIVNLAEAGKIVVRLKGGDPAVFARGAQEAEVLAAVNIPFEIVPGITAALAAGSCAGIPITHSELASAVALITGQELAEKKNVSLDYEALAKFPGTLVFYMGVTTAPIWTAALVAAGKSSDTPAAIVHRCSHADQRVIHCTLGEVAERLLRPVKIRPPAIVILGEVTTLGPTLSWFERRPLFGRKILVTRPIDQAGDLASQLTELGADVIVQPAIEITDPPDWAPVDDAIGKLDQFDWVVFSSANGVRFFMNRILSSGRDLRCLGNIKIAAVGSGTSEVLTQYHLKTDRQPAEFRAEALAEELADVADGNRFLLIRASRGREVLAESLKNAGGDVEQIVVYSSTDVTQPDEHVAELLASDQINWITVTSSAIANSLAAMFGDGLRQCQLASISPVTSATLRELGFAPAVEATTFTMSGIVAAILKSEVGA